MSSVPWWQARMLAFDLETTSADPEEARIVQAAISLVGGGERPVSYAWLVNPGVEIPADATEIHGITTERAQADGMPPAVALAKIVGALSMAVEHGWAVVDFNARFDLTVTARELDRHAVAGITTLGALLVVDPMVIDRHLEKYRAGSRKLIDSCAYWRVTLDQAHDAAFDAIAAARLAYRIAKNGRVVRRVRTLEEADEFETLAMAWDAIKNDLQTLHDWQRLIAYQQAAELEQYFRQGNPSKQIPAQPDRVVPRDWPMIPKGTNT